jgi:methionyl-tRNA formyltransferase
MKEISKTIVFFGSGSVAAKSLELLSRDFEIEAVVTKPRPAHHKGDFPVLDVAMSLGLKILTVTDKKSLDELFAAQPVQSLLGILVDFGIMVSQDVIDYFPQGIVNGHFSLLPEWRGADPITFSILSGQKQTGISLMLVTAGLDEGPLLAQATFDISPGMTTPELTAGLIELNYLALRQVLPLYIEDKIEAIPQEASTIASSKTPTYSRKLTKEDGIIDWQKPAEVIEREIRAFIEWPKSRTHFNSLEVIVTKASVTSGTNKKVGTADVLDKKLVVYCGKDVLVIENIKPAGKKEMAGKAFLAGYKHLFV